MDHGGNGMPRGMLGSGGLLGLDMAMPPHQQQMQQQAHHMLTFQAAGDVGEHHPLGRHGQYVPAFVRNKQQPPPPPLPQKPGLNSEDEPGYGEAKPADDQAARRSLTQPEPAASPWQRMKWTDSMVRLLIKVLYRVGDDGGGGGAEGEQQQQVAGGKGKSEAGEGAAAVLLQKKGKWKSVSRAMMEKGFSVSPQQCEDKFNDLNKRYKRVNDLLGKGTACRVVENQALLDTMDHLSHKAKQEARKLLNSKHLFFREMCAYHHAGGGGSCVSASAPPPQQVPPPSHQDPQQLQLCLHHSQCSRSDAKGLVSSRSVAAPVAADEEGMVLGEEVDDDVESEDEENFDDGDYVEKDDLEEGHHTKSRHHHPQQKNEEGEEDVDSKEFVLPGRKKRRVPSQMSVSPVLSLTLSSQSGTMQQLQSELMAAIPSGDGGGGGGGGGGRGDQQQWLRKKAAELEEQRVAYQCRSFQLERQRFNWFRFCTNKEREMQRTKLENERLRLENDRMLLLLRQKELELIHAGGGFANSEQQLHVANADRPRSSAA